MPKFTPISVHDLGDYLREQRHLAKLSLRQLSEVAGISNPYISQIERGLKKPSAEILQALAKALRISAESLYVRAGILEDRKDVSGAPSADVTDSILADPRLSDRQRAVLLDVYESFVGESAVSKAPTAVRPSKLTKPGPAPRPAENPVPSVTTKEIQS
jgi:transcriptional regulator with XRE-family HTH domain